MLINSMQEDKEIFLPDTTLKLKTLKSKLSEVYGLSVMSNTERYILVGSVIILSIALISSLRK